MEGWRKGKVSGDLSKIFEVKISNFTLLTHLFNHPSVTLAPLRILFLYLFCFCIYTNTMSTIQSLITPILISRRSPCPSPPPPRLEDMTIQDFNRIWKIKEEEDKEEESEKSISILSDTEMDEQTTSEEEEERKYEKPIDTLDVELSQKRQWIVMQDKLTQLKWRKFNIWFNNTPEIKWTYPIDLKLYRNGFDVDDNKIFLYHFIKHIFEYAWGFPSFNKLMILVVNHAITRRLPRFFNAPMDVIPQWSEYRVPLPTITDHHIIYEWRSEVEETKGDILNTEIYRINSNVRAVIDNVHNWVEMDNIEIEMEDTIVYTRVTNDGRFAMLYQ